MKRKPPKKASGRKGAAVGSALTRRLVGHGEGEEVPSLTGRLRFMRQAGLQYKGVRDIYAAAGYVAEGAETFDHYWSLYTRDPVAGRVVDMPAKTTWRTPPEVFEGEHEDVETHMPTAFEAAWAALAKRLRVWRHFERADRLARVGRYSLLFLGARGGDDRALATPLEGLGGPADLLYLSSFAERYAVISTWQRNPSSARFGLPESYKIELSSGIAGFGTKNVVVHHSRVIHVAEDPLVDDVYGRPALQRALNALADMLKVSASTGEAYWQLAARVLTAKLDPTMAFPEGVSSKAALTALGEDLEAIVHDLRRQFVGHGVELGWLDTTTPDPTSALEVFKVLLSVATGIPTRVFFGSEKGELASSQDERNYFGMINERQEQFAEPTVLRAFIDRLVGAGALPPPEAGVGEYTVLWPNLFELTEKETAEANKLRAEAAKALTAQGGDPMELVEVDEDRNVWLLPTEQGLEEPPLPPPPEDEEEEL